METEIEIRSQRWIGRSLRREDGYIAKAALDCGIYRRNESEGDPHRVGGKLA